MKIPKILLEQATRHLVARLPALLVALAAAVGGYMAAGHPEIFAAFCSGGQ